MTGLYSHQNGQKQLCEGIDSTWDDYDTRGVAAHTQKLNIANAMELIQDLKVEELYDSTKVEDKFSYSCLMGELGRLTPDERAV